MSEVVQADVLNADVAPNPVPEAEMSRNLPLRKPRRGKQILPGRYHTPFNDLAGLRAEIHNPQTRLAVFEPETVAIDFTSLQTDDFRLAAAHQRQQPDKCNGRRGTAQCSVQAGDLGFREKPVPGLPSVSPDPLALVGPLRAQTVRLGHRHDDRQNRHRPVRRHWRCVHRGKPVPHFLRRDIGNPQSCEPGLDMLVEIVAVPQERTQLPLPAMTAEDLFRHGLEKRLAIGPTRTQGRQQAPCPRFDHRHIGGVAHDLSDTLAFVLAVQEEPLPAAGQNPDAEARQGGVPEISCGFLRPQVAHPRVGKPWHDSLPPSDWGPGQKRASSHPKP